MLTVRDVMLTLVTSRHRWRHDQDLGMYLRRRCSYLCDGY